MRVPPRVLHVFESWPPVPSGYASRSRWIVEGQRDTGVALPAALVTTRQSVYGEDDATPLEGVPVERLAPSGMERALRGAPVPGLHRPWFVDGAHLTRGIEAAARTHRAELVHVHWASGIGRAAARAADRLGLPLVAELRFDLAGAMCAQSGTARAREAGRAGRIEALARWWFDAHLRRADVIVAASDALARFTAARLPGRCADIVTVPNGIDEAFLASCDAARATRTDPATADEGRRLVVGTTSRMLRYEGLETLLTCAAALPQVDWVFVGDGPENDELRRLAGALTAERADRVRFTGRVPAAAIPALLASMDVFAVPRRALSITRHASPIKVVEAMACARTVVATDVGDIGALLEDGRGLLVTPGDTEAFTDALRCALEDASLRATTGAAARARVRDEYRGHELIRRYADIYTRALGRGVPAADVRAAASVSRGS